MADQPKKTILVVDDEPRMVRFVKMNLDLEGYLTIEANNGVQALEKVRSFNPDLVLLDVEMPGMDGFETLKRLREITDAAVIMLTVRADEEDRIKGLDLGADDYVTKPFSLRELTARVRAVLRRTGQVPPVPEQLRAADIVLDRGTRLVQVDEHRVYLTPSDFDLLAALMSNPGRAFSRAELLDRVQGMTYEGYERTIDVHVRNLRAKIEPDSRHPRYIETVFGIGYRFAAA